MEYLVAVLVIAAFVGGFLLHSRVAALAAKVKALETAARKVL